MKIVLELLSEFFTWLDDLLNQDINNDASFGDPSKLISKENTGWCVDGKRFLDMKTSRSNFCCIAGSGRGKTQTHIFSLLLNNQGVKSFIVNDNSSELATTIPYLKSIGTIPLVMNLTKKSGVYINPLDGCKGDIPAIRKIAKSIMRFSSDREDFFSLSAENCIAFFIEYVLQSEPSIYANLGNVYRLILEYQGSASTIEKLMAEKASPTVWTKFKALAGNSEKTLKSITATCLSALAWLGENPVLCDLTSLTNISYTRFRKNPHCLFIQSPPNDSLFYAPAVALIMNSFYRFAFSALPQEEDLDIMMVLDEFSSLIPGLHDYPQIISNSRKFKVPQGIILQDESLLSSYKELKDNILGNCFVKVYHGGGQDKKSFELEKLLGTYTQTDKKTGHKKQVPLMTASQIREMDNEVLVIPSGKKPLKVKITPAYKQRSLRKKLATPVAIDENEIIPNYSIQYIDLEPYRTSTNETPTN